MVRYKYNKGFTLVELLAVLAILSIVITIVITVALNVVNSSKEKSYKVTINNIEKEASNYVIENSDMLKWLTEGINSEYEYQCITVGHLIDKGYFNGDVLNSYVDKNQKVESDDYIYMERNTNNKSLDKSKLLYYDTGLNNYCVLDRFADISVKVVPVGKVVNNFCKEKDVTIKYRIRNNDDDISNYQYKYWDSFMKNKDETIYKTFDSYIMEKNVRFDKNGSIIASIGYLVDDDWDGLIPDESYTISGIDITGPVVKIKDGYKGGTFKQVAKEIPIVVNDSESGVNEDNDLETKDLKVTIGGTVITDIKLKKVDKNNYELTVNDVYHAGELEIVVAEKSVDDNLGNPNEAKTLNPNITFSNKYMITFDGNKDKAVVESTSKEVTYNKKVGTLAKATRSGFTFTEWNAKSDGSGTKYTSDTVYKSLKDITLYAQWKNNTYNIKYNLDGGTHDDNAPTTATYGETINISKPTRSGYFFDGWVSSVADGLNVSVARMGTSSDEDKLTSWDGSATETTYFRNLSSTDGSTVTLTATWYQDTEKPTCTISITKNSTVLKATASDNKGIAYKGWSSSYSGDNSTKMTVTKTGTKTYYVKDTSGNKGSCSIKVVAANSEKYCPNKGTVKNGCYKTADSRQRCYCQDALPGAGSQMKNFTPTSEADCKTKCSEYNSVDYDANYCDSGTYSSSLKKCKITEKAKTRYTCSSGYTKLSDDYCAK